MSDSEENAESTKYGLIPVSSLRKDQYIAIHKHVPKGQSTIMRRLVYQVTDINHHGSEYHIKGRDIKNGNIVENNIPDESNVDRAYVDRFEGLLMAIDDGYLSILLVDSCDQNDHFRLPDDDVGKQITEEYEAGSQLILLVESDRTTGIYEVSITQCDRKP